MLPYVDVVTANIRLIMLRELEQTNGYTSNDSVLQMVLGKWGQTVSRDRVRTELAWLADQGLITQVPLGESGSVRVTLTERGLDVATGAATVPGVQRPGPRC
jgi:Fe2+ or Zn2+ uptake regulation protein